MTENLLDLAIQDSAKYAYENFGEASYFDGPSSRQDFWIHVIDNYLLQKLIPTHEDAAQSKLILEFGVFEGRSTNFFAQRLPDFEMHGFDSFLGLEEDWYGHSEFKKGAFSVNGKIPKVPDNVSLHKGWFEQTLPVFKKVLGDRKITLLILDADTYKPTTFVLNGLASNLTSGTVIIFDEYFGYPNWRAHEMRAWEEFSLKSKINYRFIAYTSMRVALQII